MYTVASCQRRLMSILLATLNILVITYEVLDMACQSVLSNLNSIKRHLLIEFYLVCVTDVFVCV